MRHALAAREKGSGGVARVRRAWRWWVVLAAVAVLMALPSLFARLPADAAAVAPTELATRIGGSAALPYSGSVETSGALLLPDIPGAEEAADLLGSTSRLRAWVAGPTSWRVDVLTRTGEQDTYRDSAGITEWDSERRRVTRRSDDAILRLPRAADLLPPELARRLLGAAAPDELHRLPATRVAGRAVPGLRVVPRLEASTVDHIDIWADPDTGVALQVTVVAKSTQRTALSSQFLDVSLAPVSADAVTYSPGPHIERRRGQDDFVQSALRFSTIALPPDLGGLERRPESAGSMATYGDGFGVVAVLALPAGLVERALPSTIATSARPWGGTARVVQTPLVNAMGITVGPASYVIAGPVTVAELDRLAAVLAGASG